MADIIELQKDIDSNLKIGKALVIEDAEDCKKFLDKQNTDLRIFTQNIRSLNKNFDGLLLFLDRMGLELDLLILTECWLSKVCQLPILPKFNCYSTKLNLNQNDGVVLYIRESIDVKVVEPDNTNELTCLIAHLKDFSIIGMYRPPVFNNMDVFMSSLNNVLQECNSSNIVLMGDINIDIKDNNANNRVNDYLNLLAVHGLQMTHNFLTTDKSCLDHCFIKSHYPILTLICRSTLTDHSCILTSITLQKCLHRQASNTINKVDYNLIINHLSSVDWHSAFLNHDVDSAAEMLLNIIIESITKFSTKVTISRKKQNLKPWITPGLIRCMRHRDRLHKKLRSDSNNVILKICYIRYRNTCTKILKNLKNSYYRHELTINKSNIKKQWRSIKEVCHIDKGKDTCKEILNMKSNITESLQYANNYFANIGQELANNILNRTKLSESALLKNMNNGSKLPNSFALVPTTEEEVKRIIKSLKTSSACGWDGISSLFLKMAVHVIAKPISMLCNLCFESGLFPKSFKKSVVVPIFKSGNRNSITNYRPISLLPSISKVLEKCVNLRLKVFLEKYKLIAKNQYGFRSNKSTSDAINEFLSIVVHNLDKGNKALGIFLDLAKAFDTVPASTLLAKLEILGIRGVPLQLLGSYLSDRKQCLRIGDSLSQETGVNYGIPQGSIIGPTLFLAYINGLCLQNYKNTNIITFADDTVLIVYGKSWEEVNVTAENSFRQVTKWLDDHLLTLNVTKTKFINFSIHSSSQPSPHTINIKAHYCKLDNNSECDCELLQETESIRYLGLTVDKHLKWREHITSLAGRIRRLLYIFKTLRYICDDKLLLSVYYAYCQSLISYGLMGWGGANKTLMLIIERAQRAILKVMKFKSFMFPTSLLYTELPILTVRQLYIKSLINEQHRKSTIDSQKRRKDRVYEIPYHKTAFGQSFFPFQAPYLYNKISRDLLLRNLTRYELNKKLHTYLKSLTYEDTEDLLKRIT